MPAGHMPKKQLPVGIMTIIQRPAVQNACWSNAYKTIACWYNDYNTNDFWSNLYQGNACRATCLSAKCFSTKRSGTYEIDENLKNVIKISQLESSGLYYKIVNDNCK